MRSAKKVKSNSGQAYDERINRVLDFLYAHLAAPVNLTELANLAGLSPFHFHRVFQALVGETPHEFVKRLRLEKSLQLIRYGKRTSMTQIALECGFASPSDFTRSFRSKYGVAPSKFSFEAWQASQGDRLEFTESTSPFRLTRLPATFNPDHFRVRIRELPARRIAYTRVSNPYRGDAVIQAANRLVEWADRLGINGRWYGYQFENPSITSLDDCYYCVGVEVAANVRSEGEVGIYQFPEMLVAEVAMKGDIDLEIRLLQWLYGVWLPKSRYVPADQPCFELWHGRPFSHGFQHFELSIQLPVRIA